MKQQKNKNDFQKQLQAYSTLGTAFLALAPQQAEADIVYVDIPDINVCVNVLEPRDNVVGNTNSRKFLFLDLDGQANATSTTYNSTLVPGDDIVFQLYGQAFELTNRDFGAGFIGVLGGSGTTSALIGTATTGHPRNMPYGATISAGAGSAFSSSLLGVQASDFGGNSTATIFSTFGDPNWTVGAPNTQNLTGYLGLRFMIGANTHFAWIQIEVNHEIVVQPGQDLEVNSCITILDYAYEDTPNTAILAGVGAPTAEVPTLSEWGLINLAILLMTFGTIYLINPNFSLRRRRLEE